MSRRAVTRQNDFAFGEVGPEFAAAGDREAVRRSLKKGRNVRILNSFGIAQRQGSRRQATVDGEFLIANLILKNGDEFEAIIRAGAVEIRDEDGILLQTVTTLADWTAANLRDLYTLTREDGLYIAHQDLWPRVLSYDEDTATWSLALFEFSAGAGDSRAQLYYRFEGRNIGMTPTTREGSPLLVFTEPILKPEHVGVRFRYGADPSSLKEIEIVSYLSPTTAQGTIMDELPPTFQVDVEDASGFSIGDKVEGLDSKAAGIVASTSPFSFEQNRLTILMISGFEGFLDEDATTREYLVGPSTRSKIVEDSVVLTSPATSAVWDEQVFSEVRGYPGCVFERGGRLGFTNFPQIPDGIALSVPDAVNDFTLGTGEAGDAIFTTIGGAGERILHAISAANLILFTDKSVGFVPEAEGQPLAYNTFAFQPIGPTGSSPTKPVVLESGAAFVDAGRNRVIGILATGDFATWRLVDLSEHAPHLIVNPLQLAVTNGNANVPERYLLALNRDGTIACLFLRASPPREGWTLWSTNGVWRSFAPRRGVLYSCCEREIDGTATFFLERLAAGAQLDASATFSSSDASAQLACDDGVLACDDGILTMDGAVFAHLANTEVHVIRETEYMGTFQVDTTGILTDFDAGDGDFEVGFHFDFLATRWPAEPEEDESPMFGRRRAVSVAVRTLESGSYSIGLESRTRVQTRPVYDQGEDWDVAPPLRSEVRRFNIPGWEHEPCIQITRPIPVPLQILSLAERVAF